MASSRTITRSAWSLAPTLNYAQMIKVYMNPTPEEQRRYSPARVAGVIRKDVYGEPDFDLICTSHIERLHGSLRQWCKRLTRLTYAFNKSGKTFEQRYRCTSRIFAAFTKQSSMTPAMAAGITDHVWTIRELLA